MRAKLRSTSMIKNMILSLLTLSFMFLGMNAHSKGFFGKDPSQTDTHLSHFDYDRKVLVTKFKKVNKTRKRIFQKKPFKIARYNKYEVELTAVSPLEGETPVQKLLYLKHVDNTPRPLIILIPSIMEVTPLEKLVARGLIRRGFNVFLLTLNQKPIDNKRKISEVFTAAKSIITGIRRSIDFAENRPEIDATKIGTWGNSFGGILNSLVGGIDLLIKALYISVAGGRFADTLTRSRSELAAPYREFRMKEEGLDIKGFREKLMSVVKVDPLDLTHRRSREDIFMNLDVKDDIVATDNQLELWEAYGKPNCRIFTDEHFYAVIRANAFHFHDYFRFFEEKLLNRGKQKKAPKGKCFFSKGKKKFRSPFSFLEKVGNFLRGEAS